MRTSTGENRVRRGAIAVAVAASILLAGAFAPAHAITTPVCLAKKLKAWGDLRMCQRNEDAKAVQARPANRARCQERFASILDSLHAQAASARRISRAPGRKTRMLPGSARSAATTASASWGSIGARASRPR